MVFTLFYVTFANIEDAQNVCTALLERKFIACANYFPMRSQYFWKGKLEDTNEIVAIIKTSKEKSKFIEKEIKKIHPYELPCIMKFEANANKEYENWIIGETK
jgi:periplasmic divalent cation tolerance protein